MFKEFHLPKALFRLGFRFIRPAQIFPFSDKTL
jgi:hypothetical protein